MQQRKRRTPVRKDTLYITDICREMEVTPSSVKRWIRRGDLPAFKINDLYWVIRRPAFELFKEQFFPERAPNPNGS